MNIHRLARHGALLLSLLAGPALANQPPAPQGDDPTKTYQAQSAATQSVAQAYFRAYIAKDWTTVDGLLAEQASFADPTAAILFGDSAKASSKTRLMQFFRDNYAPLSLSFEPTRSFFAGQYAVFEGALDWTLQLPKRSVRSRLPLVTTLRIENGRVVEHRDYADYQAFIEADRASRQQSL